MYTKIHPQPQWNSNYEQHEVPRLVQNEKPIISLYIADLYYNIVLNFPNKAPNHIAKILSFIKPREVMKTTMKGEKKNESWVAMVITIK